MTILLLVPLVVAAVAQAYSNTAPLVAWSSRKSSAVGSLPTTGAHASAILDSVLSDEAVCAFDAVVLVNHPGLAAVDLRALPSTSRLVAALADAPASRSYPYVLHGEDGTTLKTLASGVAAQCGSNLLQYTLGDYGVPVVDTMKHVVLLDVPALKNEDAGEMRNQINDVEMELAHLLNTFPDHLVLYSGVPLPSQFHVARQASSSPSSVFAQQQSDVPLPEGGILKRYQLLTPGLITSLLVVLFAFLPVVFVGITALASIQNPIKLDLPKGFNAQEKKNQ